jgi:prolipoprotein diacylglyceryltransferase
VPAAIRLDFSPTVSLGGLTLRIETVALAAIVLLVLLLVALAAGRQERDLPRGLVTGRRLHRDDMLLISLGVVPGAIVGGRLGYGLIHFDYYSTHVSALADPAGGGLSLSTAVVLGTLSGLAVARLLSSPTGRWLGVARLPVMLGLGLGKLAMVLGGSGQGSFSDASWATSYVGPGPWGSLSPADPALPSQALEGIGVLAALVLLVALPLVPQLRSGAGSETTDAKLAVGREWALLSGWRGFVTMLVVWSGVRFLAAFTWRDARVAGPLCAEQLVLLALVLCLVLALRLPAAAEGAKQAGAAKQKPETRLARHTAAQDPRDLFDDFIPPRSS